MAKSPRIDNSSLRGTQSSQFGVMDRGHQGAGALIVSIFINLFIMLCVIIVGATAKKTLDNRHKLTELTEPIPIKKVKPYSHYPSITVPRSYSPRASQHRNLSPRIKKHFRSVALGDATYLVDEGEARPGVMNYNPPDKMTLNESVQVDVAVRRSGENAVALIPERAEAQARYGMENYSSIRGVEIPVSNVMEVELSSVEPGAFKIELAGDKQKTVAPDGHGEWHWIVTPLQVGTKHLKLHTQTIPLLRNGTRLPSIDGESRETSIAVSVLPWYWRLTPHLEQFASDNWKDILKYFLPSSGAALIAIWWKKRKQGKAESAMDSDQRE